MVCNLDGHLQEELQSLHEGDIRRSLSQNTEGSGMEKTHIHYNLYVEAIENGMQPKSVQKLLGHGSLQLTMDLYCHVTDDTLFDEMRKMEAV